MSATRRADSGLLSGEQQQQAHCLEAHGPHLPGSISTQAAACAALSSRALLLATGQRRQQQQQQPHISPLPRLPPALLPAATAVCRRALNAALPDPVGSSGPLHATIRAASATVQLLYASGAAPMAHFLLCRPMRLSWSIATQAILVANAAAWVPTQCGASQLQAPALRGVSHLLHAALSPLRYATPLPSLSAVGLVPSPGSAAECVTLLRFVQLTLGLLVPLVWQAVTDAALFSTHQRQRAAAGLPLQSGFSARLYGAVTDLCHLVARPYAWLMAPLALGLCWQLAARTNLA